MSAFLFLVLFWLINSIAYGIATLIQYALILAVIGIVVGIIALFGALKRSN